MISENGANVYDLIKYKNVLFTTSSIKNLQKRLVNEEKINSLDSIISPVITEKATSLSEQNKVIFKVHMSASKKILKKILKKYLK